MNMHLSDRDREGQRLEALRALDTLRRWSATAGEDELAGLDPDLARLLRQRSEDAYPSLARVYPEDFLADESYRDTLPDLQNGPSSLIRGAKRQIQHVGISNFRLPIRFQVPGGDDITLQTSVTG
ncbi:MAG: GTP cyclohydrolase FolE2, partial [Tranquillimonas sp.]